jgi:parvulin-like peptidyl-prolyl isomerase
MTYRARPSSPRSRTLDDRTRRNLYLNVAFGLVVVLAIGLLALAAGLAWYSENLAPAATVNGQSISKSEHRERRAVDLFRADYQERRIRTQLNAGRIRAADAQARLSIIAQQKQQVDTLALERLIDARIQADLAASEGVTVTEAQVDERMEREATTPEMRRAWMIEVAPDIDDDATEPTEAAIAEARRTAERALADIRGGQEWETVARAVSDHASKDQGGDLGYVDENAAIDEAFNEALFEAALDTPTDVIEGEDGIFRIGRVTEIVDPVVDATLQEQLRSEGVDPDAFRAAVRAEVVRAELEAAILDDLLEAGPQRRVGRIVLQSSPSEGAEGAVKTRHILFSPEDDPQGAAELDEDDPAWAEAEADARDAHARIRADIALFDEIARAESDEPGAAASGGKLPYFSPADNLDEDFAEAVFQAGLEAGELLEPVRSQFGWHVIQIMRYPPDQQFARDLVAQIREDGDFAELARDHSDGPESGEGGDLGWIARGQLPEIQELQVFQAPVDGVSEPLIIPNDAIYIFRIYEEEVRELDDDQRRQLERTAFGNWYRTEKAAYTITRDPGITGGLAS